MQFRTMAMIATASLALAACGHKANTNTADNGNGADNGATMNMADTNATMPAASPGQSFADMAAASDTFEIETSKLAATKSSSAGIKAFAQKMITAHTGSTAKLKAATAAASPAITPSPTLNAEQQQKLDALKALSGAAFDQAYVADQRAGHQATLDTLRGYAATGDVPALKSFAAGLAPTVAAHLNMANGLKS